MEGETTADVSDSGGGSPAATSRWNPTKEQINILENLYKQGIRTPTAEQIQQITSRLQAFGHIEGKNVFYWFQNHKARLRQKQKQNQENLAYFNCFLHKSSPVFPPPPCQNVVCSPYYIPQTELGFYQQYPKVLQPGGTKRRPRPEPDRDGRYNTMMHKSGNIDEVTNTNSAYSCLETLSLFPLEPTGILQGKTTSPSGSSTTPSASSKTTITGEVDKGFRFSDQALFDFFSGNGSCERSNN